MAEIPLVIYLYLLPEQARVPSFFSSASFSLVIVVVLFIFVFEHGMVNFWEKDDLILLSTSKKRKIYCLLRLSAQNCANPV